MYKSTLCVPGNKPEWFEKAFTYGASRVCFDLEDSVKPDDKEQALRNVVEFVSSHRELCGNTTAVRINNTYMGKTTEIEPLLALECLTIIVPKYEGFAVINMLPIPFEVIIETPLGVIYCEMIAQNALIDAIHFGHVDYTAAVRADSTQAFLRVLNAARAFNTRIYAGACPFPTNDKLDAFIAVFDAADGLWAIHPSQVPAINNSFTMDSDETAHLSEIVRRVELEGIYCENGEMFGPPHAKHAAWLLRRAGV